MDAVQEVARFSQDRAASMDEALKAADEKIFAFEEVKRREMEESMVKVRRLCQECMHAEHAIRMGFDVGAHLESLTLT